MKKDKIQNVIPVKLEKYEVEVNDLNRGIFHSTDLFDISILLKLIYNKLYDIEKQNQLKPQEITSEFIKNKYSNIIKARKNRKNRFAAARSYKPKLIHFTDSKGRKIT